MGHYCTSMGFHEGPRGATGRLTLDGDAVIHQHGANVWRLRFADIAVIGEYTTEEGPFLEDWFLVFVPHWLPGWKEAPVYSHGADVVLEQLGRVLGSPLRLALASSTQHRSRVLWPSELSGEPLFDFTPMRRRWPWRPLDWLLPQFSHDLSPRIHEWVRLLAAVRRAS